MDHDQLLKQYKKRPLCSFDDLSGHLSYSQDDIKKIIPHREPLLLIDEITAVDLKKEIIMGSRFLSGKDPVFKGHFPDYPVYPGSLQLEMTGQLGLCLYYFLSRQTLFITPDTRPLSVRATRIIGACFSLPLLPDKKAVVIAKKLEADAFFGTIIGQVIAEGKVCSVSISEVCFME